MTDATAKRLRWGSAAAVLAALFAVAALTMRHRGDWAEYAAMARALVSHGSTDVRTEDLAWVCEATHVSPRFYRLGPPGFVQAPNGAFYSIHFWFFSLLGAPFLAVSTALGSSPLVAFAALNAVGLWLAALYVAKDRSALEFPIAALTLLACGGTFYLGWLGPEVLTGASVLIACLAAMRGEIGLATLAGGVAAAQNPSAAVLLPYVWVWWLRYRTFKERPLAPRSVAGVLAGVAGVGLALAPYLFFYAKFGVFSLIGERFTDVRLFGFARFFSFLFDLNQGLLVGVPGVLLGVPLIVVLIAWKGIPTERWSLAVTTLLCVGCFLGLSLPTLIQKNWNADGVAFIRYGYWSVMPLVALFFEVSLGARPLGRAVANGGLVLGQIGAFAVNGVFGGQYSYMRHNALASWVMTHAPARYNPITEIFWERTVHNEAEPSMDAAAEWPGAGFGSKLAAHWSHPVTCTWFGRPDQFLVGASETFTEHGFEYFDAPFDCRATPADCRVAWRLTSNNPAAAIVFAGGWSTREADGVWTDGHSSALRIQVPPTLKPRFLRLHGSYFPKASKESTVTLEGRLLGDIDLSEAKLPLGDGRHDAIELQLAHTDVRVPEVNGFSDDPRQLAYFLQAVALE